MFLYCQNLNFNSWKNSSAQLQKSSSSRGIEYLQQQLSDQATAALEQHFMKRKERGQLNLYVSASQRAQEILKNVAVPILGKDVIQDKKTKRKFVELEFDSDDDEAEDGSEEKDNEQPRAKRQKT